MYMGDIWPNLFIIGAAKSGTTSLYQYLKQHPQVFMSAVKEPHYFSRVESGTGFSQPVTAMQDYLQLFAEGGGYPIRGESSTSYLWCDKAAVRLQAQIPQAQVVAILRDPIERAYSHYLMDVRASRQSLSFYEALQEDYGRSQKGWHVSNLYVELGLYSHQLRTYYQVFDRAQIKVLLFSDLVQNPLYVLQDVCTFLDVDLQPLADLQMNVAHNPHMVSRDALKYLQWFVRLRQLYQSFVPLAWRASFRNRWLIMPGSKPIIDDEAKSFLREMYAPEVDDLEMLLEQPLPQLRQSW